jgi:hypothetical protein
VHGHIWEWKSCERLCDCFGYVLLHLGIVYLLCRIYSVFFGRIEIGKFMVEF